MVSTRRLAISLIASFVIGFFALVLGLSFAIHRIGQKDDLNRISNMAGRQRTLVRSLQAAWLMKQYAGNEPERLSSKRVADSLATLLQSTHFNLLNKTDSFAKAQLYHTPAIDEQLVMITPVLLQYVELIESDSASVTIVAQTADRLIVHLSKLVDVQYAGLHRADNNDAVNYLWMILLFVGGVLLFQNLFLVRPTFKKLDEKIKDSAVASERIEQQNRDLMALQDTLKEQNEELKTNQEELRALADEQMAQNERLQSKQKMISEAYKHITESIMYAARIQKAFRTDPQVITDNFAESFILEKPKDILSGDFYWYAEQGKYKILAIGDCTGHGVAAALMTMVGITTIYQIINVEQVVTPSAVLLKLHHRILEILQGRGGKQSVNDGMDISLLVIDTEQQVLTFAGANSSICLVRNGQIERITSAKLPIGSFQIKKERSYPDIEIVLQPGDKIYAYTDGFQDQFGGSDNTKYFSRRFRELLLKTSHAPMNSQKSLLFNELRSWQGSQSQTDDILVVGLQPY